MQFLTNISLPAVLPTADIIDVPSGNYTIPATANGKTLILSEDGAQTADLQLNAVAAIAVGARTEVYRTGTGVKGVTSPAGVTINGVDNATVLFSEGSVYALVLMQSAVDTWLCVGGVAL